MPEKFAKIESLIGNGRTLMLVYEQSGRFAQIASETARLLPETVRTCLISIQDFAEHDWQASAKGLEAMVLESKLKNSCVIGFGSACSLVIHLCLTYPKLVRSLILVDATTRPHPSRLTRIIDRVENYLPAGLPFRSHQRTFNAAPFLQRIRCPAAVVTTPAASGYHLQEANVFKSLLPTAWTMAIAGNNRSTELRDFIIDFQDVAAKRPQKNLQREN